MTEQEALYILENSENISDVQVALKVAIKALEEIQQYRAIGTVEDCRAAMEKQIPKKPQKVLLPYGTGYECRECGNELSVNSFNGQYCHWCGQRIDWE